MTAYFMKIDGEKQIRRQKYVELTAKLENMTSTFSRMTAKKTRAKNFMTAKNMKMTAHF